MGDVLIQGGTVEAPNRYAAGMTHSLVNDRRAMIEGAPTAVRGGPVLRKGSA